jgi:hypothetical protein
MSVMKAEPTRNPINAIGPGVGSLRSLIVAFFGVVLL